MQTLKKKKLIIANSVLMLLLIVGFVYAWFAVNYNNEIDSNNVTVTAEGALELSLDNSNWSPNLNLADSTEYTSVKFTDITGSGDGNFLRPTLDQSTGFAVVNPSGTWTPPGKNSDYVRFTLYMRSTEELKVSLGNNSSVRPSVGMDYLKGSSAKNLSSFSTTDFKFSKDIVVGALRVSAIDTSSTTSNHLFTWIPRPEIYFSSNANDYSDSTISIDNTTDDSRTHQYYDNTTHSLTTYDANLLTGDITDNQYLCTLTKGSGEYYTAQIDFCIWLEGCDNEARRAFVGGKFNVNLNLVSEEISSGN